MKLFCRFMFASATAATILAACPAAAQQQAAGVVAVDRPGESSASAHLSDEEIS